MNLGIDIGYSHTKAVSGKTALSFPSVCCLATSSLLNLDGATMSTVRWDDGIELMTGEAAVIARGQRTESPDWALGEEWLALLYTGYAMMQKTDTNGVLVTGLPVADYGRLKKKVIERLETEHLFSFNHTPRRFRPVDVRVVPQAWGPVLALMFDDRGNKLDTDLEEQRIGVIDIGGKTVNLLTIQGLRDIPSETVGLERGTWNVLRLVRQWMDREHPGLNRMSDHQVMRSIQAGYVLVQNKRKSLRNIIGTVLDQIGGEIIERAEQYWGTGAATHQRILVTGGGAYLWGKEIKRAFPHASIVDLPEYGNAQGYANFAAWLWRTARKEN